MKLRTRERYSLRMITAIAKLSADDTPVRLGEISKACGISIKYLEQLVPPLKHAALVRAISGRGGGYTLARDASEIRVSDVIRAAVGPVALTECAVDVETCIHSPFCNCRALWTLINLRINKILHEYSVADLLNDHSSKRLHGELKKTQLEMQSLEQH